ITSVAMVLLLCGIGSNAVFGAVPFSTKFDWRSFRVTDHVRVGHEMLQLIPDGVPVSATNEVIAYLSHRTEVYQFPNPFIRV
ncbi:MAG TPA: hypothetical protein DIT99_22575, partial [Candidatus Latescibacteria bacterium]|nr:hypothetical protein [Candidatus Latescibacterota bacterium]